MSDVTIATPATSVVERQKAHIEELKFVIAEIVVRTKQFTHDRAEADAKLTELFSLKGTLEDRIYTIEKSIAQQENNNG